MKRVEKLLTLSASLVLTAFFVFSVTSCSDDDDVVLNYSDTEPIELTDDGELDIVAGKLFHVINVAELEKHKLPLLSLAEVDFEIDENDYFGAKIEKEGDRRYIVPVVKKPMTTHVMTVPVTVLPKKNPRLGRTIVLVFVNDEDESSRASDDYIPEGLMSAYQDVIGRGTYCYSGVGDISGNQVINPAKYKRLRTGGYLTPNTTNNKTLLLQKHAEDYEKMSESWSLNVGLAEHYKGGRHDVFEQIPDPDFVPSKNFKRKWRRQGEDWHDHIPLISRRKESYSYTFDGSLAIGGSESLETTSDYEYFLQMLLVKRAEVSLNINALSLDSKLFCSIFTDAFLNVIQASYTKLSNTVPGLTESNFAEWFFKEWGTDVITQGTFGGSYLNIYGRSQNTYDSDIAFDASAHIKVTKTKESDSRPDHPLTFGEAWLQVLALQGSNYTSLDASMAYNQANYSSASNAVSFEMQIGGNPSADQDPSEWIAGLKDNAKSDNWALISYLTSSDYARLYESGTTSDECAEMVDNPDNVNFTDGLFPIETLMSNYVQCYEELTEFQTDADVKAIKNIMDKVNLLSEYRKTLLNEHVRKMREGERLVLADLMMKTGLNDHSESPKPFVGKNPRNTDEQQDLIYYPVMWNPKYGLTDGGYPFETSSDYFNTDIDTEDHYWYYALAPSSKVTGFTEAMFNDESPGDGWSSPRGNSAWEGITIAVKNNHIYLKWFDEKKDDPKRKATAVAFGWDMDKPSNIWASTGGSELIRNYTVSELVDWENWWTWSGYDNDPYITNCAKSGTAFYESGGEHRHWLGMLVSCKDLHTKKMTDRTVCHPLKWGEIR